MKVKVNLNLSIHYNAHMNNQRIDHLNITEMIDGNCTLGDAISLIYHLHQICLTKEQKEFERVFLTNYLFDGFEGFFISYDYEEAMSTKLSVLDDIFNISQKSLTIMYVDGIGATGGEIEGIKFVIHSNEKDVHHNKHIHCVYSGEEMRVEIETLRILDEPFSNKKKVKRALELIKKNKNSFIKMWDKIVVNGEPFKFHMEA